MRYQCDIQWEYAQRDVVLNKHRVPKKKQFQWRTGIIKNLPGAPFSGKPIWVSSFTKTQLVDDYNGLTVIWHCSKDIVYFWSFIHFHSRINITCFLVHLTHIQMVHSLVLMLTGCICHHDTSIWSSELNWDDPMWQCELWRSWRVLGWVKAEVVRSKPDISWHLPRRNLSGFRECLDWTNIKTCFWTRPSFWRSPKDVAWKPSRSQFLADGLNGSIMVQECGFWKLRRGDWPHQSSSIIVNYLDPQLVLQFTSHPHSSAIWRNERNISIWLSSCYSSVFLKLEHFLPPVGCIGSGSPRVSRCAPSRAPSVFSLCTHA